MDVAVHHSHHDLDAADRRIPEVVWASDGAQTTNGGAPISVYNTDNDPLGINTVS